MRYLKLVEQSSDKLSPIRAGSRRRFTSVEHVHPLGERQMPPPSQPSDVLGTSPHIPTSVGRVQLDPMGRGSPAEKFRIRRGITARLVQTHEETLPAVAT